MCWNVGGGSAKRNEFRSIARPVAAVSVQRAERMASWNFYSDVFPFAAMIPVECTNVVVNVLFRAATLKGMSYQFFLVYSYAIGDCSLSRPIILVNSVYSTSSNHFAKMASNFVWYIFQAGTPRMFPMELVVTFFYTLFVTIISAPGFGGCFFSVFVDSWGVRLKGPVHIASFRPMPIAIAAIMSAMFLGDEMHLGSVIGAIMISPGFYDLEKGDRGQITQW